MISRSALPHTVTVTRNRDLADRDRYNDETLTRKGPALDLRARVYPKTSTEVLDSREELKLRVGVILAPNADIAGVDTFTWQGHVFQVDGPPRPYFARRRLHHIELDAFTVTG